MMEEVIMKRYLVAWMLAMLASMYAGSLLAAPPTVTIIAEPGIIISSGQSVGDEKTTTLIWSSTNATRCEATAGWDGEQATTGRVTLPIRTTTTYALACTGEDGTAADMVKVLIQPPLIVRLTADPMIIAPGGTSTITWSTANAQKCTATGAWQGNRTATGTFKTAQLWANTKYFLTCNSDGQTSSQQVVIRVVKKPPDPPDEPFPGGCHVQSAVPGIEAICISQIDIKKPPTLHVFKSAGGIDVLATFASVEAGKRAMSVICGIAERGRAGSGPGSCYPVVYPNPQ